MESGAFKMTGTRSRYVIIIAILLLDGIYADEHTANNDDRNGCSNAGNCCHGIPGIPGTPGLPGNPGIQGPIATKGERGETGQQGSIGNQGIPGTIGPMGEPGQTGEKGNAGTQGIPGKIGPVGVAGERGHTGPIATKGERGVTGQQGSIGNQGIPGTTGPIGIPGARGHTGNKGNTGDPGPIQITPRVAFSVSLTSPVGPASSYQIVIYDTVYINIGQHYNLNTGKFTCPVNGVYYFTMTAQRDESHTLLVCLMRNDTRLTCTYVPHSNESPRGTGTNNIILDLQQGDEIWVRLDTNDVAFSNSNDYTTFSGYLIYPDTSQ